MSFVPLLIFMPHLSFNISLSLSQNGHINSLRVTRMCYHGDLIWFRVAMVHTLP